MMVWHVTGGERPMQQQVRDTACKSVWKQKGDQEAVNTFAFARYSNCRRVLLVQGGTIGAEQRISEPCVETLAIVSPIQRQQVVSAGLAAPQAWRIVLQAPEV
jgi:hypothetical protein